MYILILVFLLNDMELIRQQSAFFKLVKAKQMLPNENILLPSC